MHSQAPTPFNLHGMEGQQENGSVETRVSRAVVEEHFLSWDVLGPSLFIRTDARKSIRSDAYLLAGVSLRFVSSPSVIAGYDPGAAGASRRGPVVVQRDSFPRNWG